MSTHSNFIKIDPAVFTDVNCIVFLFEATLRSLLSYREVPENWVYKQVEKLNNHVLLYYILFIINHITYQCLMDWILHR